MPADRLAFAIRVSGQIQRVRLARRFGNGVDVAFVLVDQAVVHGEAVVGIDRALFRHQVADMAIRGEYLEILSQILVDGLRLGRRFHEQ